MASASAGQLRLGDFIVPAGGQAAPVFSAWGPAAASAGWGAYAPPARAGMDPVLIGCLVVAALALAYWAWSWASTSLPRRLAAAGWVLYVQPRCAACKAQLAVLGGKYSKVVVCEGGRFLAAKKGARPVVPCGQLTGTPTWVNSQTGATATGVQSALQLQMLLV